MNLVEDCEFLTEGWPKREGHVVPSEVTCLIFSAILKETNCNNLFEIGFNYGHSSYTFMSIMKELNLHSVDIGQYDHTLVNAEKLKNMFGERFTFSHRNSHSIEPHEIEHYDMVFIDGDHTYEGVKKDFELYSKLLTENGVIVIHDTDENYEKNLDEIKSLGVPFGFKLNGFVTTKPAAGYTNTFNKSKTGNPNEFLGHREDLIPEKMALFVKKFKEAGATILGGCCETRPAHIKEMARLK